MIETETEFEKPVHLRDYLRTVQKRKYTVLLVFVVVFTVVLIKTLTDTPQYSASTQVLIEKSDPTPILSNYAYSPFDPEFLETQSHIIKSTPVAQKVVRLLDLEKSYDSFSRQQGLSLPFFESILGWGTSLKETVQSVFGASPSATSPDAGEGAVKTRSKADLLADMISGSIVVTPVRDTKIVSINFTSSSPELASLVTNTVAKAYIEQILEMRMQSSGYSIGWMTKKAEEERAKLDKAEKAFQDYVRASDIVTIEDRLAILPQKLSELSQKLTLAQAKRREVEALYTKISGVSNHMETAESLSVIANNPTIQSLNQQLLKTEQNIMELSKRYGQKHPVMKAAVPELEMLRQKREREIAQIIKSVGNELELAKSAEEDFNRLLSETKAQTVNLNERFIQYGMLKREVDTNRNLYDALVAKVKEQNVTEKTQTVNVWVVEEAKTPEFPSKPNKQRNLLLGLILGLFGGIGLAFFLDYLDNTVKLPEDVEERLGLPVLGIVSLLKDKNLRPEKMMMDDGKSAFSEEYKTIRTAVQLSSYDSPPRTILVSSTSPQDGKTTSVINLAVAMSQTGKKVLLIDADMRRPSIHGIFELDNTRGLSTLVASGDDKDVVHKGPVENLYIMPSGPVPPNPSELLGSDRFKSLLQALSKKFDLILIDSPPMLSVADGLIISKQVNGSIIVARSGKTTHEAAYKVIKTLHSIDAKVIGVVINAADMKKSGYYYYYNNYSYYSSSEN
jgi:polysaccharide biosynthesis transport protein